MKIFFILGKSASGKDTIYKKLIKAALPLEPIIPWTTRPIRTGETNGVDYYFVSNSEFLKMKENGEVIESRTYHTVHGDWTYFTHTLPRNNSSKMYIMTGTLESYDSLLKYYGDDIIPIYITVDDGVRLQRALAREMQQGNPKYEEMCRRFLSDSKDFSDENLEKYHIKNVFQNDDLDTCFHKIKILIAYYIAGCMDT